MYSNNFNLVADIGGTNARFALVRQDGHVLLEPTTLVCRDYPSIVDAISAYLGVVSVAQPVDAAIAVAAPVVQDRLYMTNHSWGFAVGEVRRALGLRRLKVLNDFTALALALPCLTPEHLCQCGGGEAKAGQAKALLGAGTGLGVSGAIPCGGNWIPLQGEGGHVSYGPLNDAESQVIHCIRQGMGHVSAESLVSGAGLSLLYQTLYQLEHGEPVRVEPLRVVQQAVEAACPVALAALEMFCCILGSLAGNLALTLGATGGVYIGGGIVPRILDYFSRSGFRQRFQDHGRFSVYLQDIPVYVITAPYPALTGAALALNPTYRGIGITSLADKTCGVQVEP
ncbi:MAG: glucokinase [Candidatus Thiothrix moscowensis]|nr:glucokinase [Candidatus Thiothrix moscowensis]